MPRRPCFKYVINCDRWPQANVLFGMLIIKPSFLTIIKITVILPIVSLNILKAAVFFRCAGNSRGVQWDHVENEPRTLWWRSRTSDPSASHPPYWSWTRTARRFGGLWQAVSHQGCCLHCWLWGCTTQEMCQMCEKPAISWIQFFTFQGFTVIKIKVILHATIPIKGEQL